MQRLPWLVLLVAAPAAADPGFDLPEPAAPEPAVVREDTPGPLYYRLPDDTVRFLARSGVGTELRTRGTGFTLDELVGAAVAFGRGARTGLWIEGGYSYAGFGDHLAVLGVGPTLRGPSSELFEDGAFGLALVPHVVAGDVNGTFGYGVRTSLVGRFWMYGVEVAHEYLVAGTRSVHELHLTLTFPMTLGGGS